MVPFLKLTLATLLTKKPIADYNQLQCSVDICLIGELSVEKLKRVLSITLKQMLCVISLYKEQKLCVTCGDSARRVMHFALCTCSLDKTQGCTVIHGFR